MYQFTETLQNPDISGFKIKLPSIKNIVKNVKGLQIGDLIGVGAGPKILGQVTGNQTLKNIGSGINKATGAISTAVVGANSGGMFGNNPNTQSPTPIAEPQIAQIKPIAATLPVTEEKKSKTGLYVGIGVGILVLIIILIFVFKKK